MRLGRYGLLHKLNTESKWYVLLAQFGLVNPSATNQRIPLCVEPTNRLVTVKFNGHRPQKAVVVKERYAGQQLQVVFPAEVEERMYLLWVERSMCY